MRTRVGVTGWPRKLGWEEFERKWKAPTFGDLAATIGVDWTYKYTHRKTWRGWRIDMLSLDLQTRGSVYIENPTAAVLNHEQGHFDLAGIGVMRLARLGRGICCSSPMELDLQMKAESARISHVLTDLNTRYDRETRHGVEEAHQAVWDAKIETWKTEAFRAVGKHFLVY